MARKSKQAEADEEPRTEPGAEEGGHDPVDEADELPEELAESGEPTSELEQVIREREEYLAHWQRSQADYKNLRRRMQQDLETGKRRAKEPLLADILLVMDQLEMALAIPATSEDAKSFRAGIELTRDQLTRTLENEDVHPVPDSGAFDPAVHQAMLSVPTPDAEPGTVVETLRRGYTWGEHVLRFAQVKVAAAPVEDEGES